MAVKINNNNINGGVKMNNINQGTNNTIGGNKMTNNNINGGMEMEDVKIGRLGNKLLNNVSRTMLCAYVDLGAELSDEQIMVGLQPNVNDAGLISTSASRRLETLFSGFKSAEKDPNEANDTVCPIDGDKVYGLLRGKFSISATLNKFIPFVEYECINEEERDNLVQFLKETRGENVFAKVNGNNVVTEIDWILNPSTGRDNFAGRAVQSAMELKGILTGEVQEFTADEITHLNAKDVLGERKQEHRVFLWDFESKHVAYDFGLVPVIVDDMFWQPQHSNRYKVQEQDFKCTYNQFMDGMQVMLPNWYRYTMNSIKLRDLRETCLLLGLKLEELAPNKWQLTQDMSCLNGLTLPYVNALDGKGTKAENWSPREISKLDEVKNNKNNPISQYINRALYNNEKDLAEIEDLINFINSKRFFKYEIKGKSYFLVLPRNRQIIPGQLDYMSVLLFKAALAYREWNLTVTSQKVMGEDRLFKKFMNYRSMVLEAIAGRVFSKEFKSMYDVKFRGITGVCLPGGNLSPNGIAIPKWYAEKNNIKIGDIGMTFRHPVQKLLISLKVEAFTDNEIRVHSDIWVWLNGDHDGDCIQWIPLNRFVELNEIINKDTAFALLNDLIAILPTELLTNPRLAKLTEGLESNAPLSTSNGDTLLDMLEKSKKSEKYVGAFESTNYLDTQLQSALNMILVKEGAAMAGSFTNHIFETARQEDMDLVLARKIGDQISQSSIDSKHVQGASSLEDLVWYAITRLRFGRHYSAENVENKIKDVIAGKSVATSNEDDEIMFG